MIWLSKLIKKLQSAIQWKLNYYSILKGIVYERLSLLQEAIKMNDIALSINSNDSNLYLNKGYLLIFF